MRVGLLYKETHNQKRTDGALLTASNNISEWDQSCALLLLTAQVEESSADTTGRAAFTASYQEVDVSVSLADLGISQQAPTATMVRAPAPPQSSARAA